MLSRYYDDEAVLAEVRAGNHRELIGGLWDELGHLQLDFLLAQGLERRHRLLDVGCGSLRAGVHLVRYLDPGNYFGIDLQEPLINAGYEREIRPAKLADRLPRRNLRASGTFDAAFASPIDIALATSVFTHLPFNHLRWCLEALEPVVRGGGRFFVTYFEVADEHRFSEPLKHSPGDVVTMPASDPYHYRPRDILHAAAQTGWAGRIIGSWNHPRDQRMAVFERT
jgi:SAM-dependent methyltransferase